MSMDMRKFLKKFNMRNIYKNITIALIFILIDIFLLSSFAYSVSDSALRPPIVTHQDYFRASEELQVDVKRPDKAHVSIFLKPYELLLSNVPLDSFPAIKYDQEELLPTMEGRYFKDLFYYAFHELLKNLCYYSDRDYAKLYVQIGTYKECIPAMRILSRNKEPIKEIVSILHGGKIRFNSEGFGLICLKEFALINRGVWLIIDTNGGRICFSKDDGIIQDRSIYPGTEVQMIIKIPSLSTDNQSIQGAIVFKKYPLQSL